MVLLDDGRVLYWGGVEAGEHDQVFFLEYPHVADVGILAPPYDAASAQMMVRPEEMGDLFCAGQTILADGRVLTAGGSEWKTLGEDMTGFVDGEKDTWTFDPATSNWTKMADMSVQRWYPTVMTTSEGNALAASGIDHLPQPQTLNTKLEAFDGEEWSDVGADNLLPMYPRLFTVPSGPMKGDIFYETDSTLWGPFGEHPLEATWSLQQVLDTDTNTWSVVGPSVFGARQHANTVMLPLDPADDYTARLVTLGGSIGRSIAGTNLVEMTTLGADGVSHDVLPPLAHPRWFPNTVILPDGKLLTTGGGLWDNVYAHGQRSAEVLVAESFDPATGAWTQMAPMTVGRTYHSTSILLPDGRVLVGGHVPLPVPWTAIRDNVPFESQIAETRFEIYEPPYLHYGVARPTITEAPEAIAYGESFTIGSPDADQVVDAMLIHPGATTHAWDVNERAVMLPVQARGAGTLTFTAPPDGDVAMPGPWMLFVRIQSEHGVVPSVAKFVSLG
ncbi:MAG TPA: galactose oxidase-like domain-containing protein [Candidatus Thermoplasmatota archaeon]|nr:galactose oxidase-like domain-containing protein [Candidatus Thermoplasmatota archaeon]